MRKLLLSTAAVLAIGISGCAVTSSVMDTDNGTYMISAAAAPIRGGTAGANSVAYDDAQRFCAQKGMHAVVLNVADRDVYQGSFGGSFNQYGGGFGGGTFASGRTNLRFKCGAQLVAPAPAQPVAQPVMTTIAPVPAATPPQPVAPAAPPPSLPPVAAAPPSTNTASPAPVLANPTTVPSSESYDYEQARRQYDQARQVYQSKLRASAGDKQP
jgi:hypothetical protein